MTYHGGRPLVWFLHFHKAGGSSVVELARRENLVFAPWHANGNPLTRDGKFERPWELSTAGITAYVDDLRRTGTQFVATEWGVPDLDVLSALPDVELVTVLRDPVDRLVSNFRFDRRQGFTAARTVLEYVDHHVDSFTFANHYTREVLGRDFLADADPQAAVEEAARRLRLVHHLAFLDQPRWLEDLAGSLGWGYSAVHVNRMHSDIPRRVRATWRLARRGRFDVAARALRPDVPVSARERAELEARNTLDRQLLAALRRPSVPTTAA